jgi:hypothetical protein
LEAKVFDKYHNEIYNIKRTGFGRAYAAVYYGYWNSEALTEASEVLAVKDGIEQIFTTIKTLKSNTNLLDFITY